MKKVLLTATVQSHICQFHRPLADMLHKHGCEVHVAAKNNLAVKNGLVLDFADKVFDVPFSRSPKSLDNINAYKQLKRIIAEEKYDVIHCNTPMGGIITRLAARTARKEGTTVIYTAHGFHFYRGAPLQNWLIYYSIEKAMARMTDVLITINQEDYALAKDKMKAKRVEYIPGVGVDIDAFVNAEVDQHRFREMLGLMDDDFVIATVGELNQNKNQQVIIKAIAKLQEDEIHFLLAGNGPNLEVLQQLADELGVSKQVHFLGYRRDIAALYKSSDLCTLTSLREGLPVACIEALSSGIPVIAAKNRGTSDLISNGENGFLFEPFDVNAYADIIRRFRTEGDSLLKYNALERRNSVRKYDQQYAKSILEKIYLDNMLL